MTRPTTYENTCVLNVCFPGCFLRRLTALAYYRIRLLGAKTPWYRVRLTPGLWHQGGQSCDEVQRAEVLMCAGTIHTPRLLQLSGIGAGEKLSAIGVAVINDLPGVGENLQDHLLAPLIYESIIPTANDQ